MPMPLPAATHPPDPFAEEYKIPSADDEVGATAGQFRAVGSSYLALGRGGPSLGVHGTLELMTFAYLGVRGSLQADAFPPARAPSAWLAKTGPSLHLFPYHRFDVSLFFEAGIGVLDPFEAHHTAMPVLAPGGTVEAWLSSSWFLRAEGHIDWGIYELGDGPRAHLREVGLLGIGYAL